MTSSCSFLGAFLKFYEFNTFVIYIFLRFSFEFRGGGAQSLARSQKTLDSYYVLGTGLVAGDSSWESKPQIPVT